MEIGLIIAALAFCGASVYCFCKANFCACTKAGECDNPVNHYWLGAILTAMVALLCCCAALHSENGTLLWLLLMCSCFSGALLSAKQSAKRRCDKSITKKGVKPPDALLTNEPS
ncbi:hypothetical protein HJP15_10885 [Pseudoalteromonas sp. NEC-BIFX-2020_002]|uniref:Uncharacterized protein n=2 Tax=Pseudoalteromonas TaxID=53246 RepID=A0A0N0LZA6_9GAMM|nr:MULTISPECIES: hypothetical protein [Pseudoalteromonas]KPH62668.1 hypothetical protein ADS77_11445 [Pseudoalteromonas porphyrae]NMR24813.1 hypothetical protein [Pseudoalteromonas sp. NEC-BIFX-2020_015]NNG43415.1 hypothetical protein [Pseudoalteromonas sp. NEC-BIFX-2020_002]